MAKRYVYMVKTGSLDHSKNRYEFYNTEMFSSKVKALERCQNGLDCNKAYDIDRTQFDKELYQRDTVQIDFTCKSTEGNEMNQRYWIEQLELR